MSPNNCPTCGSIDTHQEVTPYGFIRTCNNGPLLIGTGGVDAASIRKPAANKYDKLVKSMGRR